MNNDKFKKISLIITIIVIVVALALFSTWLGLNWKNITSGTKLYTESELIDYGEERYQAGTEKGEEYRVLVDKYKVQVQELEVNVTKITILLENEKAKNDKNEGFISTLETTITNLRNQIQTLKNEVTRLTGLIESYEDISAGTHEVNFYIGNTLFKTKAVRFNTAINETITPPENNEYRFDGWSTDRINIISVNEFVITENTNFYAVITQKFKVEFISEGKKYVTQYVVENEKPENISNPTKEFYEFLGWTNNGVLTEPFSKSITQDVVFTASFKELYEWVSLDKGVESIGWSIESGRSEKESLGFEYPLYTSLSKNDFSKIKLTFSFLRFIDSSDFTIVILDEKGELVNHYGYDGQYYEFSLEEGQSLSIKLPDYKNKKSCTATIKFESWNSEEKAFYISYTCDGAYNQLNSISVKKVEVYKLKTN